MPSRAGSRARFGGENGILRTKLQHAYDLVPRLERRRTDPRRRERCRRGPARSATRLLAATQAGVRGLALVAGQSDHDARRDDGSAVASVRGADRRLRDDARDHRPLRGDASERSSSRRSTQATRTTSPIASACCGTDGAGRAAPVVPARARRSSTRRCREAISGDPARALRRVAAVPDRDGAGRRVARGRRGRAGRSCGVRHARAARRCWRSPPDCASRTAARSHSLAGRRARASDGTRASRS